jgi:hypothetical protein
MSIITFFASYTAIASKPMHYDLNLFRFRASSAYALIYALMASHEAV